MTTQNDQNGRPAGEPANNSFELDEFGEDFPPGELSADITGERSGRAPELSVGEEPAAPVTQEAKPASEASPAAKTEPEDSTEEDFGEKVVARVAGEPEEETKPPVVDAATEAEPVVEQVAKPAETPPAKTPEELQQERNEFKSQLETTLTSQFQITDDELASISDPLVDPQLRRESLSRLMARGTVHAVELVMSGVAQTLPALLTHVNTVQAEHAKWRSSFFGDFPDLNNAAYGPTIDRMAVLLASDATKAGMTPEQFKRELGIASSMALKVKLPAKILQEMARDNVAPITTIPAARPTASRAGGAASRVVHEEEVNEFADL